MAYAFITPKIESRRLRDKTRTAWISTPESTPWKYRLATEISGVAAVQTSTLMGECSGDFPCGRSPKHPLGPGRQKRRLQ